MYTDNDPKIHRDYVQQLIAGKAAKENESETETRRVQALRVIRPGHTDWEIPPQA